MGGADAAGRDRGDKGRQAKSPGGARESLKHGNILPGESPYKTKACPVLSRTSASAKEPGYTPVQQPCDPFWDDERRTSGKLTLCCIPPFIQDSPGTEPDQSMHPR